MKDVFQELAPLFFSTRQIIRQKLPDGGGDPNAWLRFETLRYIDRHEGPTMHDVARHLRVKAPSATSLVRNLATRGAIIRRGRSSDKRVVRLYLTSRGKRMLSAYTKRSTNTMRVVFSKFTDTEVRELARLLRHLKDIHSK